MTESPTPSDASMKGSTDRSESAGKGEALRQLEFAQQLMDEVPRCAPRPPLPSDQLALVLALEVLNPRSVTVKELQRVFDINVGSMHAIVARAEKVGLVRRKKNHIDHRETMVELTAKARRLRMHARRFENERDDDEDSAP